MNFFKTTIFAISAVALTLGFASCSDDDDDNKPTEYKKTEWTVKEMSSDIKLVDSETENPELITAIEAALEESDSKLESIVLYTDGKYKSTLKGGTEEGVYKLDTDSLILTVKSTFEAAGSTAKSRAYGVKMNGKDKMELTEDVTSDFKTEHEEVDYVHVIYNAEGVESFVAEPYN